MARPERNTVDYFPHYISDGKKMFTIEKKYGNDGYACWFKLLEALAKTNNHWLNLNDDSELMYLASKCNVEEQIFVNILNDLARLEEIDSQLWKSKIVFSQKFVDSVNDAYKRRSNECITYSELLNELESKGLHKPSKCIHKPSLSEHKPSNCMQKSDINPQSKVKKSKVKKSKEEKSKEKGVIFPFDSSEFYKAWNNWLSYKKSEFNFSYKSAQSEQSALKKLSTLSQANESVAIQIIHESMSNGWKGFFKLKNVVSSNNEVNENLRKSELWDMI